jgi:hypothetical protein
MDALRARRTAAWFGGMLWGREALLSDLMRACVKASKDGGSVVLENRCPIAFKGTLQGAPDKAFELPAYGRTLVDWTGSDSFVIRWDSVWTSPTSNLVTKEAFATE